MISINIPVVEEMIAAVKKAASEADEALALLKRTASEINDDSEFFQFDQSGQIQESIARSADTLFRANDHLQSLKNVLLTTNEKYCDVESENMADVKNLTSRLEKLFMSDE